LEPAAVIVEILNDDGTMARRDELIEFARRHELKIGTIADLIKYRLEKEESVEAIGELDVETAFGKFRMVCFEDHVNRTVHLALVRGRMDPDTPTLVRVHRQETLADVIGVRHPRLGWPLRDAMRLIAEHDHGVIVLLRQEESPRELMRVFRTLAEDSGEVAARREKAMDLRTIGTGAQVLRALGVRRMRVLSAPKNMHGLSGFGLEVVEYVSASKERNAGNG
ncbi:MAG: 3,4-dihydroxy-2-butanone-4-phosphate synthase, partial [Gammaproteobacteria bacterium]|nr:3,4-dihydroxy-2-butanone-4-phosphate synthase [Gammaproteobacteria bacterium]